MKILRLPKILHLHMKQEEIAFCKPSYGLQYMKRSTFQRTPRLLSHSCIWSVTIRVDIFSLFLNSIVSKADWLDEHAGSVCCSGYWDSCCISDADCGDLVEKKREAQVVEQSEVCNWVKKKHFTCAPHGSCTPFSWKTLYRLTDKLSR